MQTPLPLLTNPAPLEQPPLWEYWAFESPNLPVAVLVLTGLGLGWWFWSRDLRKRSGLALGACLVLAIGLFALAQTVVTPRERVQASVRTLIYEVLSNQGSGLAPLLSPQCRATDPIGGRELDAEAIVDRVQSIPPGTLIDPAILELQAHVDNSRFATAQVKIRVTAPQAPFGPILGWWRLSFESASEDQMKWLLTRVESLTY